MKEEIKVGVEFLRQFLAKYGNNLHHAQIDLFALKLELMLEERYENHWYDKMPMKGQAFRCLRVKRSETYIDPVLERLLSDLKLNLNQLGLPNDFTLWIDPGEVSVRFGDQVGYTYTIARLNTSPSHQDSNNTNTNSSSLDNKSIINNKTNIKPTLVVQNAEKILFDEKLSAFIRQNSCNNTNDEYLSSTITTQLTKNDDLFNDLDDDSMSSNNKNDFVIDELIKLSAEKRTISPPHSGIASLSSSSLLNQSSSSFSAKSQVKRQNSSNIAINNNNNNINDSKLSSSGCSANTSSNRLSFNDSCYYSSSSSSCASSFGSNEETNLLMQHFGWFNNSANTSLKSPDLINTNKLASIGLFTNSDQNQFSSFNYNSDQTSALPFAQTSSLFSDQNTTFMQSNPFSFNTLNSNHTNLYGTNVFDAFNKLNYLRGNNTYSDASSERSDTPNSCITQASYLMIPSPLSFTTTTTKENNTNNLLYDSTLIEPTKPDLNKQTNQSLLNVLGSPLNSSSSSSSSSTASTKTISQINSNQDSSQVIVKQDDQIDTNKMDSIVESSIEDTKKSETKSGSSSPAPSSSPTSNDKKLDQSTNKKEEPYCGYVESFPYYYKLNRLYNALAVQKMQTERLRKSGLLNSSNSSSLSTTPNNTPNQIGFNTNNNNNTPNNNINNMLRNLNSNSPKSTLGTSPNQYINRLSNSNLSSSPSLTNSSILNSTSPPGVNISKTFNSRTPNNLAVSPSSSLGINNLNSGNIINNTTNSPVSKSPSNANFVKSQNSSKNYKSNNQQQQIGYPMSPTNAAISFANHQNRNNMNRVQNHNQQQQQLRFYGQQSPQQQHHHHQQQQQHHQRHQMLQTNLNSSVLYDTNSTTHTGNNNNNNNLLPLLQQQQQQQQELLNLFNQMNLIRSQDLVKSKN